MYTYDYLPITKEECPVSKLFAVGETVYIFEFIYNDYSDTFSVILKDTDENILYSTRLTYWAAFVNALVDALDMAFVMVPVNLDDIFTDYKISDQTVNGENLGKTVQIYFNGRSV